MTPLFTKLNLGTHRDLLVVDAPASFEPELAALDGVTLRRDAKSAKAIAFVLVFVKTLAEVESAAKLLPKAVGDAIVWFAYPKGTSKRYKCEFNRDNGWAAAPRAAGFRERPHGRDRRRPGLALRFRRSEYVKPSNGRRRMWPLDRESVEKKPGNDSAARDDATASGARILAMGPVQAFREPGGQKETEFFLCTESGPFVVGTPEEYALSKEGQFPGEGGAVILALDVPDEVVQAAVNEFMPLEHGPVDFEPGKGLEELLNCWPTISRHCIDPERPMTKSEFADRVGILKVSAPIIGQVDELVALSRFGPLRLDFVDDHCRIHATIDDAASQETRESVELPWRHGIFRTAACLIACVCNQ